MGTTRTLRSLFVVLFSIMPFLITYLTGGGYPVAVAQQYGIPQTGNYPTQVDQWEIIIYEHPNYTGKLDEVQDRAGDATEAGPTDLPWVGIQGCLDTGRLEGGRDATTPGSALCPISHCVRALAPVLLKKGTI